MIVPSARPVRVLIAHADENARAALVAAFGARAFGKERFEVWQASDGPDALDVIGSGHVDAALLHEDLPGLTGWQVLKRARRLRPQVPILLVAATGEVPEAVQAIHQGAADYLPEPADPSGWADAVRAVHRALQEPFAGLDLAARRELQERLLQAQRLETVGMMASGVAHDINNLLLALGGSGQLILDHKPGEEVCKLAVIVKDTSAQLANLNRQLLDLSNRQQPVPGPLDLNALLDHLFRVLKAIAGEGVKVVLDLDPTIGLALADRGQVMQVLLNLVKNARDAMPAGGRLTLSTATAPLLATEWEALAGPFVVLAVSDTGCGMDAETRARLFEPFFTTKPPGQGTGLGLWTIRQNLRQSGGDIDVESTPGEGTTFSVYFPRSEAAGGA